MAQAVSYEADDGSPSTSPANSIMRGAAAALDANGLDEQTPDYDSLRERYMRAFGTPKEERLARRAEP